MYLGLTRLRKGRGKTEHLSERKFYYSERKAEVFPPKADPPLAGTMPYIWPKPFWKSGFARLKNGKRVCPSNKKTCDAMKRASGKILLGTRDKIKKTSHLADSPKAPTLAR